MRAVLLKNFGSVNQLYIDEVEAPTPGKHEVLIKVYAAGINRADILQRQGKYPPPKGVSEILGLEIAGEVISSPSAKWQEGERVFGLLSGGGYAQYAVIHEDMLMAIPENMTYNEAAAIPEAFLTAYQSLVSLANLERRETILIHAGASGVGTAAIQIAKLLDAKVIVTASKGKHKACYMLGADYCIDYKSADFSAVIEDITHSLGVDVILDFIAAHYFKQNLRCLSMDGRLIMLAFLGGIKVPEVNLLPVVSKRLKIIGSTLRNRSLEYQINLTKSFTDFGYDAILNEHLKPVIDKVFPWSEVQAAHQYMESNKNTGKLILKIEH